jgi:hypothetical protein
MQRLAIFTVCAVVATCWIALQQHHAAAYQTEPEPQQSVASENQAATGQDGTTPATDPTPPTSTEAQPAAPVETPPDPAIVAAAETLLRDARDRLYAYHSVRATFVERANLGNRRFAAKGAYLSGDFPQLKLEYRIQIGGSEGVLIEVCDGNVLRTSKEIRPIDGAAGEPTLSHWTRKDIKQILEASYVEGTPDAAVLQAELSLGGVPTLLASLERTMLFDTVREQTWQGRPTTVIEGGWRTAAISRIAQQMGPSIQQVVQFIPDRVRIYFDKQTLFPTRILYRKQVSANPVAFIPLLSIEFTDIRLNEGVDAEEFRYVPPKGVDEVDETLVYLKLIEQIRGGQPQPAPAEQPADAQLPTDGQPADTGPEPSAPTP